MGFRRGHGDFPGHSKHMRRRYRESLRPESRHTQAKRGELVKSQEAVNVHSRHWPFHTLPEWSAVIYCGIPKRALLAYDCKHFATVDTRVKLCCQRAVEVLEKCGLRERAFAAIRQQHRHTKIVACQYELGFQLKRALE